VLPKDLFHAYDGPTVFGLDTEWTATKPNLATATNESSSPASPINHDVEITHLPPWPP
jgi:hypothetical protein